MARREPVHSHPYPWDSLLETADEDEVVAVSASEPRRGVATPLPDDLHPALRRGARHRGHRGALVPPGRRAGERRRGHTIVTTGTASGKSLAFNLPVLDTLAADPSARAFYLYPTKALAQDQARKLSELGGRFLRHAIYDGDTPREERRAIRGRSNLILTNPDMLHVGVLPNHRSWGDVLANLAWVVVDEAHVYRGVFGSHVANVLRRLRRLARAYGAEPRFVLTSATIANPRELAEGLTGLEMLLVDRDGAPHAERQVVMWNPPLVDEQLGKRASALSEAALLLAGAGGARGAHDLLPQVAPRRGADPALRAGCAWRTWAAPTWPSGSPPIAPATRRRSGARSSAGWPRASCWPWWPPTRSSSASTWASSTPRSA